jgi:trans-2,3-dihydro-3-hydroxyanthranilate isomerase
MKATIAWWDLTGSPQTIDTLRTYLAQEGVKPWAAVKGLLLKFWISDPKTNRWGAVMLWDGSADAATPMPPNRATDLIGYAPTLRMSSDIEALVGNIQVEKLDDRGLAFATPEAVS